MTTTTTTTTDARTATAPFTTPVIFVNDIELWLDQAGFLVHNTDVRVLGFDTILITTYDPQKWGDEMDAGLYAWYALDGDVDQRIEVADTCRLWTKGFGHLIGYEITVKLNGMLVL